MIQAQGMLRRLILPILLATINNTLSVPPEEGDLEGHSERSVGGALSQSGSQSEHSRLSFGARGGMVSKRLRIQKSKGGSNEPSSSRWARLLPRTVRGGSSRGSRLNQTAPLFLKMHKVGSTSLSSMLECSEHAVHSQTQILECLRRTNHPLKNIGQFSGLWDHSQIIQLGKRGTEVLQSTCFQLKLPGQQASLIRANLPQLKVVVLLREPLARFVSFTRYFFLRGYGHGERRAEDMEFVGSVMYHPRNATAEDALHVLQLVRSTFPDGNYLIIVDQYARIFHPDGYVKAPPGAANGPRLSLSDFVVGITERMMDSKLLVAVELGLPANDLCEPKEVMRANGGAKSIALFGEKANESLREALSAEIAIYNAALGTHKRQLESRQVEIESMREVFEANEKRCGVRRGKATTEIRKLESPFAQKEAIVQACAKIREAAYL